jgi:putative DNA primase/helicase
MTTIGEAAKGNWVSILSQLGIDRDHLQNKHGPCPICHGKDRFRFDDQHQRGGFICNQCGAGDGFSLAQQATGMTFHEVAGFIEEVLGLDKSYTPKPINDEEVRQKDAMRRAWEQGRKPENDGPVARYLKNRVGCLWPSNAIREHSSKPAMMAKIITHNDQAVNLHITLLDFEGNKAKVEVPKKVMPGKLPDGCAIRLAPARAMMGVAEGIETAISAAILYDMPVWACVNGNLLSKWIPPEIAEEIVIFGDNDRNFTGQAKAYHLANRLTVQFKRKVYVEIPKGRGDDWGDVFARGNGSPRRFSRL